MLFHGNVFENVRCKISAILSKPQCVDANFRIIPMADGEENLRMIDDGFGQICHMVNDQCMRVRSEAAGLLVRLTCHCNMPSNYETSLILA